MRVVINPLLKYFNQMRKKTVFKVFAFCIFLMCSALSLLVLRLNARINNSLKTSWFPPPVRYYTAPKKILVGSILSSKELEEKLTQRHYKFSQETSYPDSGYFLSRTGKNCPDFLQATKFVEDTSYNDANGNNDQPLLKSHTHSLTIPLPSLDQFKECLLWKKKSTNTLFTAVFVNNRLYSLQKENHPVSSIDLEPVLFAEYENGEPVLRQTQPLDTFPFNCRQAVLSAEDHQFILHEGISLKAIIRAIWSNIRKFRLAEGGSTITQQLVKNLFFSQKKSFWRKFQEQITALLLEIKLSKKSPKDKIFEDIKDPKDKILTAYLNIIYMGQSGSFRIHGFGSASEYYIGKPVSDLNLSECALLAGIIKSPGRYKPSKNNNAIFLRRNHILKVMYQKQIINEEELKKAQSKPIKKNIKRQNPSAYFTDAVYKQIKSLNIPMETGLKIFTTLYPDFQAKADQAVQQGLKWLEKNRLKKNLKSSLQLQSALINVDVSTGAVRAITGGRDFKASQFNRAIQAKRQIGSLMKPVVILSALLENPSLTPISLVKDKKFTHKYGKQSWSPKNYKENYKGTVPLYLALAHSLNAGIARLGIQTGLNSLVQTLQKLGGPSNVSAHPSLILGAIETSPWETAQIFLTIANMGQYRKQYLIQKVTDLSDNILYEHNIKESTSIDAKKTAVLVGMLKEVTQSGTARGLKSFSLPVAGKTGTTNEEKDAWFVGFTPESLTVVWVGFDDNRSHYLTGATGALPIWKTFMKKILPALSQKTFDWPEGVAYQTLSQQKKDSEKAQDIQLIFEQ